jgi:hypothetical protein
LTIRRAYDKVLTNLTKNKKMSEQTPKTSEITDYVPNPRLDMIDEELIKVFDDGQKENRELVYINIDQIEIIDDYVANMLTELYDADATYSDTDLVPALNNLTERSIALKETVNRFHPDTYKIH